MKKLNYKTATWKQIAKQNAKVVDELLTLFNLEEKDLNIIDFALEAIAGTRKRDGSQPVTVSLIKFLIKRHYLNQND